MYYAGIKHSGHLRTLEKCRKHSPTARIFYISFVFSNARRVLSQCNTRLRLLYLLIILEQADVTAENQKQRKEGPAFPLHRPSFVTRLPSSAFSATKTNHHPNRPFPQFRHHRHCHMTGPRNRYWLEAFLFTTRPTFHFLGKETNPWRQPKEFHPRIPALKLTSVVLFSGVRIFLFPSKNFLPRRR